MKRATNLLVLVRNRLESVGTRPDHDFLPPAEETVSTPPSPKRIAILVAICATAASAIVLAFVGKIDVYAVAPGKIQPSGRSKVVQPNGPGTIQEILVRNGSIVHAGDLLIILDPTEAAADQKTASQGTDSLLAEIARRNAAITAARADIDIAPAIAFPKSLNAVFVEREKAVLEADLAKLNTSINVLRAQIDEDTAKQRTINAAISADQIVEGTLAERQRIRADLAREGWDSKSDVIDANEQLEREQSSIASERGQLNELNAEISNLKRQIRESRAQFISDNAEAIYQAQQKYDSQSQQLVKTSDKLEQTRLTAPIDGIVQELSATTLGQFVSAGQQLMTIVPLRARLQVEALVSNQDIGFINAGDKVVLKVDAFPYTRYGVITGAVRSVSHDSVDMVEAQRSTDTQMQPVAASSSGASPTPKVDNLVYPVLIDLDQTEVFADGKRMPLSAGMTLSAEIRTDKRRVVDYILSPLEEVGSEAGHER